mmetsp:Transcript_15826/g.36719  ORF Transcript_15826/g.36719 Transcript_15826/m.36719 type:complete len:208 (-) Transcript_15826:196-819(-)
MALCVVQFLPAVEQGHQRRVRLAQPLFQVVGQVCPGLSLRPGVPEELAHRPGATVQPESNRTCTLPLFLGSSEVPELCLRRELHDHTLHDPRLGVTSFLVLHRASPGPALALRRRVLLPLRRRPRREGPPKPARCGRGSSGTAGPFDRSGGRGRTLGWRPNARLGRLRRNAVALCLGGRCLPPVRLPVSLRLSFPRLRFRSLWFCFP